MGTIKIYPPVEVFDDPEFCFAHDGHCPHFYKPEHYPSDISHCRWFLNEFGGFRRLEYHKMQQTWVKYEKCKDHFSKPPTQQISEKAIAWLFDNHPEAYRGFYELIDQ